MEFVAAILTVVAIVLFILESRTTPNPPNWRFGWIGLACLATALLIWHTVGGLEPVIKNT